LCLIGAEHGNPNEVWHSCIAAYMHNYKATKLQASKPTVRKAETFSGKGKVQEAKAISRKARGIPEGYSKIPKRNNP
jgi:hypothetical protein